MPDLIDLALAEDIGSGDITAKFFTKPGALAHAKIIARQSGCLAGIDTAGEVFQRVDSSLAVMLKKTNGDSFNANDCVLEVSGNAASILTAERTALNFLQHLSGVATLARRFADEIQGTHTRILDTRKTTPNFRLLEKEAVRIGGGTNHRFGLYDMIMLKDNHIDFCGGVEKAIEKTWHYVQTVKPALKIEVEARSIEDVKKIISVGRGKVFRILLDNFTPPALAQAVSMLKMEGGFETEASGGINLANIESYAQSGVDYVSVGALIHQARSVDLSLKAVNF